MSCDSLFFSFLKIAYSFFQLLNLLLLLSPLRFFIQESLFILRNQLIAQILELLFYRFVVGEATKGHEPLAHWSVDIGGLDDI